MPDRRALANRLGERVRQRREAMGLSIHGLSRRSGISPAQLSRIESGERQPSVGSLVAVAHVLQITAGELLEDQPQRASVVVAPGRPFDQDGVSVTPLGRLSGGSLESFRIEVPGAEATWPVQQHAGEECVYVVDGTLRLELDDEVHLIDSGNAAHYPATRRHRFTSANQDPVLVILVTGNRG